MIMRPSSQLKKMITDPPRNALYPAQNLDGDIFSDISAALGGSLATASSIIESKEGTMLYEAPHGTAHDLYLKYLETDGKQAHFNSSALIYALANALETLAQREDNEALMAYSGKLKEALIETVAQGKITGDLKGQDHRPAKRKPCWICRASWMRWKPISGTSADRSCEDQPARRPRQSTWDPRSR